MLTIMPLMELSRFNVIDAAIVIKCEDMIKERVLSKSQDIILTGLII